MIFNTFTQTLGQMRKCDQVQERQLVELLVDLEDHRSITFIVTISEEVIIECNRMNPMALAIEAKKKSYMS